MQQNRADILRRRIELYRRLLSKGVDANLASVYLFEIGEAELELAELQRSSDDGGPGKPSACLLSLASNSRSMPAAGFSRSLSVSQFCLPRPAPSVPLIR